jgi:hypothetical protein
MLTSGARQGDRLFEKILRRKAALVQTGVTCRDVSNTWLLPILGFLDQETKTKYAMDYSSRIDGASLKSTYKCSIRSASWRFLPLKSKLPPS